MGDFTLPAGVECAELEEYPGELLTHEWDGVNASGEEEHFAIELVVKSTADQLIAALCALVRDYYNSATLAKPALDRAEQAEAKLAAAEEERDEWEWVAREQLRVYAGHKHGEWRECCDYVLANFRAKYRAQKDAGNE